MMLRRRRWLQEEGTGRVAKVSKQKHGKSVWAGTSRLGIRSRPFQTQTGGYRAWRQRQHGLPVLVWAAMEPYPSTCQLSPPLSPFFRFPFQARLLPPFVIHPIPSPPSCLWCG